MKTILTTFKRINREYLITSGEFKKVMKLKGDISSIGLQKGRSPNDVEEGKSPDGDIWYIYTTEKEDEVRE